MECISNKKVLKDKEVCEKLNPKNKLNEVQMKVMKSLLSNYPRKPTKKDLEFITKEEEAETMSEEFLNMFEDYKEEE